MRLIDANSLQRLFDTLSKDEWNKSAFTSWAMAYEEAKEMVDDEVTVDAVPVVRCKECKFHRGGYCLGTGHFDMPTEDDGFCSWGERREDEAD